MPDSIHITGAGTISAIGRSPPESLKSIFEKKSGIGKLRFIETRHKDQLSIGEVPYSDEELVVMAGVDKDTPFTRTALLGIIAAREAIKNAGLTEQLLRTGLVSATSVGGMGHAEKYYQSYLNEIETGDFLRYIDTHECGESTERIAEATGIKGYMTTISTACSSSANAVLFGARLIRHGILDRVVVGGTDALSKFTINGFLTLKILDPKPCRPFDESRAGLNLGEGAGYLVLESAKAASGKKNLARLTGYGNSNDAYHQTASSPEGTGAFLAMKKAFEVAGINPSEVGYINAHGTGTELNDLSEGIALTKIFGKDLPPVSSTKAFTGHTLGAAGGLEAVLSVAALINNTTLPGLNFTQSMSDPEITPCDAFSPSKPIEHVLSNSFGFGGNTTSLIFSK